MQPFFGLYRLSMQPQSQGGDYLEDGVEGGDSVAGEGLVEAFVGESGVAGDFCHALGPGNVVASCFCFGHCFKGIFLGFVLP